MCNVGGAANDNLDNTRSRFNRIADGNGTFQGETGESWRIYILDELKSRLKKVSLDSSIVYERAVEK